MPARRTSPFLKDLQASGLVDERTLAEIAEWPAAAGDDPRTLARELVDKGVLTPFQATHLLAGRAQGFFIGPYTITDRIGAGGMGQVYKAVHRRMERTVALKVLPKARRTDPQAQARFMREVRASAQLQHANIVTAYDVGEEGSVTYLAMEYVEGTGLDQQIKTQGRLDPQQAARIAEQVALALEHARQHGIVHRDIKPANILINRQGTVKVLDMGLARFEQTGPDVDESTALTRDGVVMGTLDYLAPEQAMDSHTVDTRADIYSLGCTLYHMLTGRVPFPARTAAEKLMKHQMSDPEPVGEQAPDMPAGLDAVVAKMMAKRPEDRYPTPADVADALRAVLAGAPAVVLEPVPASASDLPVLEPWSDAPEPTPGVDAPTSVSFPGPASPVDRPGEPGPVPKDETPPSAWSRTARRAIDWAGARRKWVAVGFGASIVLVVLAMLLPSGSDRGGQTPTPEDASPAATAPDPSELLTEFDRQLVRLRDISSFARAAAAGELGEFRDKRAVLPLIKALEDEYSHVRKASTVALGTIGDTRAANPLRVALKDQDPEVRASAAGALGKLDDPRVVDPLATALKDLSTDVRVAAARALGRVGTKNAVEPLLGAAGDGAEPVRHAARQALADIGRHAGLALTKALGHKDPQVRTVAQEALARTGRPAVRPLIEALTSEDPVVRESAAKALQQIGSPAIPALVDAMDDLIAGNRIAVVGVLVTLRTPRVAKPLVAALDDDDSEVRQSARQGLERMGGVAVPRLIGVLKRRGSLAQREAVQALVGLGPTAVPALMCALSDEDQAMRMSATTVLARIGAPASKALVEALSKPDAATRAGAVDALARMGAPAVDALVAVLGVGDGRVRRRVHSVLVQIGAPAAPGLVRALGVPNADARRSAAQVLDQIGWRPDTLEQKACYLVAKEEYDEALKLGAGATKAFAGALKSTDSSVRSKALDALKKLKWQPTSPELKAYYLVAARRYGEAANLGSAAVEPLLTALERNRGYVNTAVIRALGEVGDRRAVDPLVTVLKGKSSLSRSAAARALGQIGDRRAIPALREASRSGQSWVRDAANKALAKLQAPVDEEDE